MGKESWQDVLSPCVPGLEINWIDEVVDWSKTAWGGKQSFLMFEEVDATTSPRQ